MSKLPRGIRNHNPGNLKYDKRSQWQGLASPPSDGVFCVFQSAPYGIRALARVLIKYRDERKAADGSAIDTVDEVISRFAPNSENDTRSYVAAVCRKLQIQPNDVINLHEQKTLKAIVKEIIRHENGQQPYSDEEIDKGLLLAGVEKPRPPSIDHNPITRTAKGTAATGIITAAAGAIAAVEPAMPVLAQIAAFVTKNPQLVLIVVGLVAFGFAAWTIHQKLVERRKGIG